MKKIFVLVCICIVFLDPAFSFSKKIEYLCVANYSKQNIIVEIEFNAGGVGKEQNYLFIQTVGDLTLEVKDELRTYNIIKPNDTQDLHEITPLTALFGSGSLYERMLALPFMEKISAIYKKLTILREDGSVALTLDTLSNRIIKREVQRGYTAYYIEIFDNDFEGKPASQW